MESENTELTDSLFEFFDNNFESIDQDKYTAVRSIGESLAVYLGDKDMEWFSALEQGYEYGVKIAQEMYEESLEEDDDFDPESDLQSDLDRTHAHQRGEAFEDEDEDWDEEII